MLMIHERRMRDEKMKYLLKGNSAYAETNELIRLLKREIERIGLHVHYDHTKTVCWFIPQQEMKESNDCLEKRKKVLILPK